MTEWLTTARMLWALGALLTLAVGVVMAASKNRRDRRLGLRLVFTFPAWPVWIVIGIVIGIGRFLPGWWKEAWGDE